MLEIVHMYERLAKAAETQNWSPPSEQTALQDKRSTD
jgi:hypothetical protein